MRTGSLFTIVFVTSWLGNIVLTILAFTLAFTHSEPLSPWLMATVAACILSGNSLPIVVYGLFLRGQRLRLEAEEATAAVSVREALQRSESVLKRLEDAEGSIAKSLLLARQLPERIAKLQADQTEWAEVLERFDLSSLEDYLKRLETVSAEGGADAKRLEESVQQLRTSMDAGMGSLQAQVLEMKSVQTALESDGVDEPTIGEQLDLLREAIEGIEHSQDSLLLFLSQGKESIPVADETDRLEEEPGEQPKAIESAVNEPVPEAESVPVEEPSDAPPAKPLKVRKQARPEQPSNQFEMRLLEDGPESVLSKDRVHITLKAMVGIHNKVYIRGDEPHLSWEAGQRMDLSGIGEFVFQVSGVTEAMQVAFWLNDEKESNVGQVQVEPGQRYSFKAAFPV
jgi:hypothetical protein